jgi:hypothetical protein
MYQPYPSSDDNVPSTERQPPPRPVVNAARLMYAGAAASLINVIIGLTVGISKSAIHKADPSLTPTQLNRAQGFALVVVIIGGIIGIALWLIIARSCLQGRNWARITGTVFFAIETLAFLAGLRRPDAAVVKIYPVVVWLIGLGAVVFLWQRASSDYFGARSQAKR